MVMPSKSSYFDVGITGNVSSFEKNNEDPGTKKPGKLEKKQSFGSVQHSSQKMIGPNKIQPRPEGNSASASSRKNNQWNARRDIPAGTVRNNPFLPSRKEESPDAIRSKNQWNTADIPKGSVSSRVQQSNSPRKKIGFNGFQSASKAKTGHNRTLEINKVNVTTIGTKSPRERNSSGKETSWLKQQSGSPPTSEKRSNMKSSSHGLVENTERKDARSKRWEPSREIPNGTVKGRVSSLFGPVKSGGATVKSVHKPAKLYPNTEQAKKIDTRLVQGSNSDGGDEWIIPERSDANVKVFAGDWGEAVIPTKSAESDDWETPAKEWMRSGESQTIPEPKATLQASILQPRSEVEFSNYQASAVERSGVGNFKKGEKDSIDSPKTSGIQVAPSEHRSRRGTPQKKSNSEHKSDLTKSFLKVSTTTHKTNENGRLSASDDIGFGAVFPDKSNDMMFKQSNPTADEFGFPVTTEVGAYKQSDSIGEVIGGDEFFDVSTSVVGVNHNADEPQQSSSSPNPVKLIANKEGGTAKGEFKKKKKSFFKGLFGRKSKEKEFKEVQDDFSSSHTSRLDSMSGIVATKSPHPKAEKSPLEGNKIQNMNGVYPHTAIALNDLSAQDLPRMKDIAKESSLQMKRTDTPKDLDDDIFADLDYDSPALSNVTDTIKDEFVDPELDHLGAEIDSEEDSLPDPRLQITKNVQRSRNVTGERLDSMYDSQQYKETSSATEVSLNDLDLSKQKTENRNLDQGVSSSLVDPKTEPQNPLILGHRRNAGRDEKNNVDISTGDRNMKIVERKKRSVYSNVKTPTTTRTYMSSNSSIRSKDVKHFQRASIEFGPKQIKQTPSFRHSGASATSISGLKYNERSRESSSTQRSQLAGHIGNDNQKKSAIHFRYTKSSIFHKNHNEKGEKSEVSKHNIASPYPKVDQSSTAFVRDGQYRKSSSKFSKASHAYQTISNKVGRSDDSDDHKRYLSIPSASTSASDISSTSSTFENYEKRLVESLKKANMVPKNHSEYSFHSSGSADDSTIESDIRVLKTILRRPRLDQEDKAVITASRQIQAFPTYDIESATDPMQRVGLRLLSSAIIPIQTEVRRFLASRQALTRMWAILVVQSYTRRFLAKQHYKKSLISTVRIQAAVRGHLARNDVIDKHICAIEIQRFVRGYLATMKVYEEIYKVTLVQSLVRMKIAMDHAAYRMSLIIQLQAVTRGYLVRRHRARLDKCATIIQSGWRCFYNRLTYQFDLLDIIIVQSLWRKKLGIQVAERKLEERRNHAATLIQAEWRAYDCKMDFLCYLSARTIQTIWRSYYCQRKYIDYRASTRIQSLARMFLCRLRDIDYRAARSIQSAVRMHLCRTDYQDYLSAKKIQSVMRMFLCQSQYREYQCASKIQSIGRMYLCRYDYTEYRAARAIQAVGRMYLCRYDYVEYVAARAIQSIGRMYLSRYDFVEYRAARSIQAKFRMFIARTHYVKYKCAVKIQSLGRMYLCRYDYVEYRAATALQSVVRMHFCRLDYVEYKAATAIQAAWRCHDCRMDYLFFTSSRKIQSIGRMFLCRQKFVNYKAARRIQSLIRMYLCRSSYLDELNQRASTRIQATWRMCIVRQDYIFFLSARLIQTRWRAYACRRKFISYLASRVIQTSWRAHVCRKIYIENFAATMIQAKWRSYDCSSMYKRYCAARTIQKNWRSYDCQMNFLHFLADILIVQSTIRRHLAQKRVNAIKNQAATSIQSYYRRYACLAYFERKTAATTIQRTWRGFVCYADYEEFKAARKIQAAWRGFVKFADHQEFLMVRKIQTKWRAHHDFNNYKRLRAATKIQAALRRMICYNFYQRYMAARRIQSAWRGLIRFIDYHEYLTARKIQSAWRGYICSRNYQQEKRKILRERSAILIQSTWRGFVVYADYMFELSDIVVVQKEVRGWLARRRANERRHDRNNLAATTIQKNWRRSVNERKFLKTLQERDASIIIQTYWRRYWCFSNFIIALDCSIQIQAHVRRYICAKEYFSQKRAAVAIQNVWRKANERKIMSYLDTITRVNRAGWILEGEECVAATNIQRVFRGSICRTALKVHVAAVLIQSCIRGKQARTAVRLYVSVRKIQAAWRAFGPRQSYVTYIGARKIQAIWRGVVPRQCFVAYIAARRIQNSWRSFKARQDLSLQRRKYIAASLIQSAWRGFVCYSDYVFTISDIVALQRIVRGYLCRIKFSRIIKSNVARRRDEFNGSVMIQRTYRGYQARQNYWYALGCTIQIQSWWRGRRICLKLEQERRGVLVLQCFARCALARQEYMQRRFVFMLIQTAELERSKKINALKVKEQAQDDMDDFRRDEAARIIQRFFMRIFDNDDELVVITKHRRKWRKNMLREKDSDDIEEVLLENIWTTLLSQRGVQQERSPQQWEGSNSRNVAMSGGRPILKQKFGNIDMTKARSVSNSALLFAPHPTSLIQKIRKMGDEDMTDDFRLEEAFIDAEIFQAKERRHMAPTVGLENIPLTVQKY